MADTQNDRRSADKVVDELQKEFTVVGSHRVHPWYAWAIVGIAFGMAIGIVYVSNRNVAFEASEAKSCPYRKDGSTDPISAKGVITKTFDEGYTVTVADLKKIRTEAKEACEADKTTAVAAAKAKCPPIQKDCKKSGSCKYQYFESIKNCSVQPCQISGNQVTCSAYLDLSYVKCACTGTGNDESTEPERPGTDGPAPRRPK